jgi:hypothetical protein
MKISDVLRKMADAVDAKSMASNTTVQRSKPVVVSKPEDVEGAIMVPPLQAKLEILKKSEGLPNVYDEDDSSNNTDELSIIKKNAGLSTAQKEASDDEPLDV